MAPADRRAHLANVHALFLDPLTPEQRPALGAAWAAIQDALPEIPDELEPPCARRVRRRDAQPRE